MRVMISCGEPSGDLYAGALTTEILKLVPSAVVTGFGGGRLRAAGATLIGDFEGVSVTGLIEVARVLPRTYAIYRQLLADAKAHRPDVFVAVDFPDFNFRLARALRARGIPVIYYISPQIWAWRRGRMKVLREIADQVLVIFPFEEQIYREAGIPVQWVGHPLLDLTGTPEPRDAFLAHAGLDPVRPVVALLPGSRRNELRAILPDLAAAAAIVRQRHADTQIIVGRAPHLPDELFEPLRELSRTGARVAVIEGRTDDVLAAADVALVASGTVTVQAALHGCPMVVVYRLSALTYKLGRRFVRVDTFAMANLVAGKKVVPELIQDDFTPEAAAREALQVLEDPAHRAFVRSELAQVRAKLGTPGASGRAAKAVVALARRAAVASA